MDMTIRSHLLSPSSLSATPRIQPSTEQMLCYAYSLTIIYLANFSMDERGMNTTHHSLSHIQAQADKFEMLPILQNVHQATETGKKWECFRYGHCSSKRGQAKDGYLGCFVEIFSGILVAKAKDAKSQSFESARLHV